MYSLEEYKNMLERGVKISVECHIGGGEIIYKAVFINGKDYRISEAFYEEIKKFKSLTY